VECAPKVRLAADSPLEEAGIEPLVPSQEGTGSPVARVDIGLSACPANCEKDGGTTSSNPLSSREESANRRSLSVGTPLVRMVQGLPAPGRADPAEIAPHYSTDTVLGAAGLLANADPSPDVGLIVVH